MEDERKDEQTSKQTPRRFAIAKEQRDALYQKIQDDNKFREALKTDWRRALTSANIDVRELDQKEIRRQELVPMPGAARAGVTIVIIIFAKLAGVEEIRFEDSVVFE